MTSRTCTGTTIRIPAAGLSRQAAKVANFAINYGANASTVAKAIGLPDKSTREYLAQAPIRGWTGPPTPCATCGRKRTRGKEIRIGFGLWVALYYPEHTRAGDAPRSVRFCRTACAEAWRTERIMEHMGMRTA